MAELDRKAFIIAWGMRGWGFCQLRNSGPGGKSATGDFRLSFRVPSTTRDVSGQVNGEFVEINTGGIEKGRRNKAKPSGCGAKLDPFWPISVGSPVPSPLEIRWWTTSWASSWFLEPTPFSIRLSQCAELYRNFRIRRSPFHIVAIHTEVLVS